MSVPIYPNMEDDELKENDSNLNNISTIPNNMNDKFMNNQENHKNLTDEEKLILHPNFKSCDNICHLPLKVVGIQKSSPISWSQDGTLLAFCSLNHSIFIFQMKITKQNNPIFELKSTLNGHISDILYLSFHPLLNNILCSGGSDGFILWDLNKEIILDAYGTNSKIGHESRVECGMWVHDGTILATGSKDSFIKMWKFDKNSLKLNLVDTLSSHKAAVLTIDWCKQTNHLYSAGRDSVIKKWDISSLLPSMIHKKDDDSSITCSLLANMDGHRGDICTVTSSIDGRTLISGARDNTIKIWDLTANRQLRTISSHKGDIRRIILVNDEKFMYSASLDGTIKLWALSPINSITISESVLTADDIERDRENADRQALEEILAGTMSSIRRESNSTNIDSTIGISMLDEKDELLMNIQAGTVEVSEMEINPKFPIIVTSGLFEVRFFDISNLEQIKKFKEFVGHSADVTNIQLIQNDQRLISSSLDFHAYVYDTDTLQNDCTLRINGSILSMDISPDEKTIFCAGNEYTIHQFSLADGTNLAKYFGHAGHVYAIAINPEGNVMASSAHDYTICTWKIHPISQKSSNVETYSPIQRIQLHEGNVMDLYFNQQNQMVSCSVDHSISLWNVKCSSAKLKQKWSKKDAHDSVVSSITIGSNKSSNSIFSGSWDQSIRVWDSKSKTPSLMQVLRGHQGRITALRVTLDGRYLISGSADSTSCQWDAIPPYELKCIFIGSVNDGSVNCLSVGKKIFSAGYGDGAIKIWPICCDESSSECQDLIIKKSKYLNNKKEKRLSAIHFTKLQ